MTGYLQIVVSGDDLGVQAMLLRLNRALEPTGVGGFLSTSVDPWLRQRSSDRFANEGDDAVGQWLPLGQATQEIRASLGYGAAHPINRRTGELENYIVHTESRVEMNTGGATLTYPGADTSGELENKVRTAQSGKQGNPYTPPRPVLGLSSRDLEFVLTDLGNHIRGVP